MSYTNESFGVKVFFERTGSSAEIRRLQVNQPSYLLLIRKLEEVFPALVGNNEKFDFFWKDHDGDLITFSSDQEVKEAVTSSPEKVVRIYIKDKRPGPPPKVDTPKKEAPYGGDTRGVLHPHVVCDGCQGAIYGCRYKCTVCPDYDLCSNCREQGKHPEHDMTAITTPRMPRMPFGQAGPGCPPPPFGSWYDNIPPNVRNNWFRHCRRFMERMGSGPHGQSGPASWGCCPGDGSQANAKSETKTTEESPSEELKFDADYLRHVGETVAAILDPFGIDVKVDVETDDGVCHRVGVSAKPKEKNPAEEKMDTTETKGGTSVQGSDSDGWTILAESPQPTPEQTSARIAEALEQMKAMGFEDDGGWLTQLLQAKGGNISRVLDAIQAKRN